MRLIILLQIFILSGCTVTHKDGVYINGLVNDQCIYEILDKSKDVKNITRSSYGFNFNIGSSKVTDFNYHNYNDVKKTRNTYTSHISLFLNKGKVHNILSALQDAIQTSCITVNG